MRLAFTHNLRVSSAEEQAEFDSPETIAALRTALAELGHEVHLVEVSELASHLVARLEALNPDLVFNTAEGSHGRYREAFYPALFEQLRLPFTGSDAYVCALTLDKQATKLLCANRGIPTPKWFYFDGSQPWSPPSLRYPVIVKPNFEGSSKGITSDSVLENEAELRATVERLLARYETGVLVEEYIEGVDVTVPFLAGADTEAGGVLEPASYAFDSAVVGDRKYVIYDYTLKNDHSEAVRVQVPADVPAAVREKAREYTRRVCEGLGVQDFARVDFRVTPEGEVYFIEVNALPSLEPGASIYESAARCGLTSVSSVLEAIVESAAKRYDLHPVERKREGMRIGITFNLKRVDPRTGVDRDAEFDTEETVNAIKSAIEKLGHEAVLLEATPELLHVLPAAEVDVVFNIAEGLRGRNREAQIPAVLELLEIPYTGSDPATLAITLDKGLAKRLVREAGIRTPGSLLLTEPDVSHVDLRFPLIVKPNAEGSSKGVTSASVVHDRGELAERVAELVSKYRQNALVEEYLPGREFTVAVLGEQEPRVLPAMEIVFDAAAGKFPVYTYGHKLETEAGVRYVAPAPVPPALADELREVALGCFWALGCRDVARIDLRLDTEGRPNFIECNPLPGLTPNWSDLCLIAKAAGIDYDSLIGEILAPAIRRWRVANSRDEENE